MKKHEMPQGLAWRLALTIYGGIGFLIFLIAFLAFYPTSFSLGQNAAIIVIAILVLGAIISAVWIPWKLNYWTEIEDWAEKFEEASARKHRRLKK